MGDDSQSLAAPLSKAPEIDEGIEEDAPALHGRGVVSYHCT